MKYIILAYTSDIDIKNNTSKIRYLSSRHWVDDIRLAMKFATREEADKCIESCQLRYARSYGVEE